ncbi:MAG: DUF1810 domain-containing protein [Spirochaetales bacterium]|nr:DUF1810 domain-containing protein [Spirochaetales bacterium]
MAGGGSSPGGQGGGDRDPFDLERFVRAQEGTYAAALAELESGQKRSHWMWYVFPQVEGLGHSGTSRFYAIRSLEEARRYLEHPVLGKRLLECAEALLGVRGRSASQIFGYPDDMKLRSAMTLFSRAAAHSPSVFDRVLERYFQGEPDGRTLALLETLAGP